MHARKVFDEGEAEKGREEILNLINDKLLGVVVVR
jgi:hypothetical protein